MNTYWDRVGKVIKYMGHWKFLKGSNISAYTWISSRNYLGSGTGVGWKTAEDSSSGTNIFHSREA